MATMLSLRAQLKGAKVRCPLTNKTYIPLQALDIITWQSVQPLLGDRGWWQWLPCWDHELSEKIQGARKIIAILVWIDQPKALKSLVLGGLVDGDLPLSQNGVELESQHGKQVSKLFPKKEWTPTQVEMFLNKQWKFLVPPNLNLDSAAANDSLEFDSRYAFESAFNQRFHQITSHRSTSHNEYNCVYEAVLERKCQGGFDDRVSSYCVPCVSTNTDFIFREVLRILAPCVLSLRSSSRFSKMDQTRSTLLRRKRITLGRSIQTASRTSTSSLNSLSAIKSEASSFPG